MNKFVLGNYRPGNSYLHKMDPRVKIIGILLMMVAVFFLENYYEIIGVIALLLLILLTSKLSVIQTFKGLKPLIILSMFVFGFQILFNRQGEMIYSKPLNISISSVSAIVVLTFLIIFFRRHLKFKFLFFILYLALVYLSLVYLNYPSSFYVYNLEIYKDGLNTSLFVFFRLIAIVMLSTILTLTTKPTDLTLGIEWLIRPLKVVKINSEEVALIFTIALRYIPTILDEAFKIMDAQASRGADFKNNNVFKKISQLVSLLVPMFVISFERSDSLADAMIARNYIPGKKKTKYHVLKWHLRDTFGLIFSLLFLGGSICLFILF